MATFVPQIIFFGGLSTTVRSFCILQFYFLSTPSFPYLRNFSKLVDNLSPGIELYFKNIHSICILQTTAIRHHHRHRYHQSQTPRLDWSSLLRLRFFTTCSPTSLLVIPSSRRFPTSKLRFTPLPSLDVLNHRYSTQSTSPQIQVVDPVVLSFLGVGLSHTHVLCFLSIIPSVILCLRTHCATLFVLDMHVFARE